MGQNNFIFLLSFTLVAHLGVKPTSAQYCGHHCYEPWLDLYDWIGSHLAGPLATAFGSYASDLRYIRGMREMRNARATAYSMDLTGTAVQRLMQENMAYATAIINPADNGCNPMFITTYPFYSAWLAGGFGSWHCKEHCQAAAQVSNLNAPLFGETNWNFLGASCATNDAIQSGSLGGAPCAPIDGSVMELAFYNSNNQLVTWPLTACWGFDLKIAINVADETPTPILGFDTKGLHPTYSFWPVHYMKYLLNLSCCSSQDRSGTGRRFDQQGNDWVAGRNDSSGAFVTLTGSTDELNGDGPEPNVDGRTEEQIRLLKEKSLNMLKAAMKELGMDDSVLSGAE